jgi:hypothetical protein
MQGTNLYLMKIMSVFVNMDRMMGRHFETGLGNLQSPNVQNHFRSGEIPESRILHPPKPNRVFTFRSLIFVRAKKLPV